MLRRSHAGGLFDLPVEVERGHCSLQGSSAESATEPSDPQSVTFATLGYPARLEASRHCSHFDAAGTGRCSKAELPSFGFLSIGVSLDARADARVPRVPIRATTGRSDRSSLRRTAHSAGLCPGLAVAPVSAGRNLMCISPRPVSCGRHII